MVFQRKFYSAAQSVKCLFYTLCFNFPSPFFSRIHLHLRSSCFCVLNQCGVIGLRWCMCACVWLLVLMLFDRKVQQAIEQEDSVGSPVTLHHHSHQKNLSL